jgi:homoserine kinase
VASANTMCFSVRMHCWCVGKGVSSSAALEVAVMQALNVALKLGLDGMEIAKLCQKVWRPGNLPSDAPGCHVDWKSLSLDQESCVSNF